MSGVDVFVHMRGNMLWEDVDGGFVQDDALAQGLPCTVADGRRMVT